MNNSESGFNAFSNGIEQPINPEQTRQPSPEETKKLGSSALAGYGPNTQPITETIPDNNETETAHENLVHKVLEKAKGSRAFKAAVAVGLAATMALSLVACGANKDADQIPDQSASEFVGQMEKATLSGEQLNGVIYDYGHYADREGKESANAYDYDMSDCYGDEEAFKNRFMEVAERTPEALASYVYMIFADEEKQELGISGQMSMVEIDNTISNDENGGILQKQLLDKLQSILQDKETTRFNFYKENDYETSSYTYFVDDNDDGTMVPVKMHLGQAYVKRSGAPQVDIERKVATASGSTVWAKVADINLRCGGQVNGRSEDFPGVPVIDPNNPTPISEDPTTPNPTAATEETIKPKDRDNLSRIDEQIQEDIAEDVGTGEVKVTSNSGVSNEDLTDKPSSNTYQSTGSGIVQNDSSINAEPIQNQVSPENSYSEDRGGANSNEYAPVQDNQAAQDAADALEIPIDEAPIGGAELQDILGELGIN